jgi:large repetitive protein
VQGLNFGSSGARVVLGTQEIEPNTSSHTALVFTLPAGQGANVPLRVSVGGQLSAATSLSYDPPVLTGISPANGPSAGGTRLTLTGTNFGLSPSVSIGGRAASLAAPATHTSLEVDLPAGEGTNQPVLVTVDGRSSGALEFDYDPPVIQNVVASSFPTAGGSTVTLTGLNFGLDPSVKVNGIDATIVAGSASHESVSFLLPAGQGTDISVVLRAAGSNSAPVLISYDAPIIQQFSAASAPTAGGITITIHGLNFGTSRIAQVGGNTISLQPASTHTQLVGLLPAGQGTNLPLRVIVGGRISNSLSFSYDAPLLTSVSPATGATAGGSLITLTGSNFGVSPMVFIGTQTAPLAQPSSHNTLVVTSPAGAGAGLPVKVLVVDRFSNIGSFSYLPPTITSISPASGPIAGGTRITINGANFGPAPAVRIDGKPVLQFDLQSHTRIVGTLPPGSGQNKPVIVTAEGQDSNIVFFSYETEGFSDWSTSIQWNGLDSSLGADPRNTGWKNSLAYAFGVDPTTTTGGETASRNPRIHGRPAFSRNVQGNLQLSFWRRRTEAYPDLIYQVEFSGGLGSSQWEPASFATWVETVDDVWEFCIYTDHSGGAGRFGRVQIRIQP